MDVLRPLSTSHEAREYQELMSDSSTKEEQKRCIAAYLEHLTQLSADAINTRDFDLDSPARKIVHARIFESLGAAFHARPGERFGIHDLLAMLQHATDVNPKVQIRLTGLSTEVSESLERAVVYYNVETSGAPPGIIRQGVCCAEYQLNERGEWLRVKHKGISLPSNFAFPRTHLSAVLDD